MKSQACGSALLILVVLALVVAGCASQEDQTSTRVRVGVGHEPSTLDPSLMNNIFSSAIISELAPSLTALDPRTGDLVPRLAREWDVSADGLVWTFRLRDNVYWVRYDPQGGDSEKMRMVTAHDVVYGTQRTLRPRVRWRAR